MLVLVRCATFDGANFVPDDVHRLHIIRSTKYGKLFTFTLARNTPQVNRDAIYRTLQRIKRL